MLKNLRYGSTDPIYQRRIVKSRHTSSGITILKSKPSLSAISFRYLIVKILSTRGSVRIDVSRPLSVSQITLHKSKSHKPEGGDLWHVMIILIEPKA